MDMEVSLLAFSINWRDTSIHQSKKERVGWGGISSFPDFQNDAKKQSTVKWQNL